jgi:palmitoyl-protein thioesterase
MTILFPSIFLLLAVLPLILASSLQNAFFKDPKTPTSLPVVFWHGLGDTYDGKGLAKIAAIINETYPGTFIHSIYLEEESSKDRNAGFIGHVADQVLFKGRRGADDRLI